MLLILGEPGQICFRVVLDAVDSGLANGCMKRLVIIHRQGQCTVEAVAITCDKADVLLALVKEIKEGIGHCKEWKEGKDSVGT